jgi:hypothetical protein
MRNEEMLREAATHIATHLPKDVQEAREICERAIWLVQWQNCQGPLEKATERAGVSVLRG